MRHLCPKVYDTMGISAADVSVGLEQQPGLFLVFKVVYFVFFGSLGVISPTFPVFFETVNHFNKYQIGILQMIPNAIAFFVSPFMAALADRYESSQTYLFVYSLIIGTILTMTMLLCKSFIINVILVFLTSVAKASLVPTLDARTIGSLSDSRRYGEIRLYGALSFGLLVLFTGWLIDKSNDGSDQQEDKATGGVYINGFKYVFYLHLMLSFMAGILVIFYPIFPSSSSSNISSESITKIGFTKDQDFSPTYRHLNSTSPMHEEVEEEIKNSASSNIGDALVDVNNKDSSSDKDSGVFIVMRKLINDHPDIISFILIVFLSGLGDGVIDAFLFLRLKELGGSGEVMGIARFITCMAEIPMFHLSGYLQEKFGTYPLLAVTQLAFVVRFVYYATLTDPWYVLPCEALNGITFAVTWSVCCTYASAIAPEGATATIQSVLDSLHWGLGSGSGALVGGVIYEHVGSVNLFYMSALLSAISMLIACVASMTTVNTANDSSPSNFSKQMKRLSGVNKRGGDADINRSSSGSMSPMFTEISLSDSSDTEMS